jgi:hypothetical protein
MQGRAPTKYTRMPGTSEIKDTYSPSAGEKAILLSPVRMVIGPQEQRGSKRDVSVVIGWLGVGVEVDVVDWSGGGETGLWTASDGSRRAGLVVWLCAGDCTAPAALVREPIGGAGAGVASDVPEISPSRFRLTPRFFEAECCRFKENLTSKCLLLAPHRN